MGQVFNSLPTCERAQRCRDMADALLDLSLNAKSIETSVGYLDLAADWLAEARGLERETDGSGRF